MEAVLRQAMLSDLDEVEEFYGQVSDDMAHAEYSSKWTRGVYPSRAMLERHISLGNLFVLEIEGDLAGSLVLDHKHADGYEDASWLVQAEEDEIYIAHIVAVATRFQGKGLGRAIMRQAADVCRMRGGRAIRLDVIDGNVPAMRMYEKAGFRHIERRTLHYEGVDPMVFELYELEL